jgi:hypothetical protein
MAALAQAAAAAVLVVPQVGVVLAVTVVQV